MQGNLMFRLRRVKSQVLRKQKRAGRYNWNQVKALRQKVSFLQVELCTASSEYRGKRSWPGQGYLIVQPATGLFSRIKWLRSLVAEM